MWGGSNGSLVTRVRGPLFSVLFLNCSPLINLVTDASRPSLSFILTLLPVLHFLDRSQIRRIYGTKLQSVHMKTSSFLFLLLRRRQASTQPGPNAVCEMKPKRWFFCCCWVFFFPEHLFHWWDEFAELDFDLAGGLEGVGGGEWILGRWRKLGMRT